MLLSKLILNLLTSFIFFYVIYYIFKFLIKKKKKMDFNQKNVSQDDLIHPENAYMYVYIDTENKEILDKIIKHIHTLPRIYKFSTVYKLDFPVNNIYEESKSTIVYYPNFETNKILIFFQHRYFDGKTISSILSEAISDSTNYDKFQSIKHTYYPFWEEFNIIKVLLKYFKTKSSLLSGTEKYHRYNRFYKKEYDEVYQLKNNLNAEMSTLIAWQVLQQAHLYSEKESLNVLIINSLNSNKVPSNNKITFFFLISYINDNYKDFEVRVKKSSYILNSISGIVEMGMAHKLTADGKIDVNLSILPLNSINNNNFVGCTERLLPINIFTFSTKKKISYSIQINSRDINPDKVDQVLYDKNLYSKDYQEIEDLINIFDNITNFPKELYSGKYKEIIKKEKLDEEPVRFDQDKILETKNIIIKNQAKEITNYNKPKINKKSDSKNKNLKLENDKEIKYKKELDLVKENYLNYNKNKKKINNELLKREVREKVEKDLNTLLPY